MKNSEKDSLWIMRLRLWRLLIFVLLLPGAAVAAVIGLPGNPPVTAFSPTLDVYPQNFAIAQDATDVVYLGNSEGVLTFDGERWTLVPLPNGDLVRSLASDAAGRVYVGGYDVFGYLERDAAGELHFRDLTARFAALLNGEQFADIWDIVVTPQGVFFRAVQHLFHYVPETGAVHLWKHAGRFGAILQWRDTILVQFRGEGLRSFQNNSWVPVSGSGVFQDLVYQFLPVGDNGLLSLARNNRWQVLRDGVVKTFAMPVGFPAPETFTTALVLTDGTLVFGSRDGALYFLQPDHRAFRRFQLATERIDGVIVANDGGLLAVTNEGFYRIAWPTRWTRLGKEHGLRGALHRIARWGQRWFALTSAGIYQAVVVENGAARQFQRLDWAGHEAWDLLGLDDSQALVADSYHLQLIDGERIKPLSGPTFYPRMLLRSRFDPALAYVGTEIGFGVVRRTTTGWRLVLEQNDMENLTINSLVETAPGELWAGSERGGIWHIQLSPDGARLLERRRLGTADGIAYGKDMRCTVAWLADSLVLATGAGFYHRENGQFVSTAMNGLDALRAPDEVLQLVQAPDGEYWAFSEKRLFHRPAGQAWRHEDASGFEHGALQALTFETGGAAILATSDVLLRYGMQSGALVQASEAQKVSLSSVEYVSLTDDARHKLNLSRDQEYRFTQGEFGLAFRFALPDYRRTEAVRYQVRLVPYEQSFSNWSKSSGYMYSRLSPGEYRLELRGRDSAGHITEIQPFHFTVLPYWYASTWAWVLWAMLALLTLVLVTRWWVRTRTRRLALATAQLEDMVRQRTRALESANRLLESLAHLDSLTEIPNRRRLDEYLLQTWEQCFRQERPLALLLIDVDHFKDYNDHHGHLAGDALLKRLASMLSDCLRRGEDLVARYGGEEFLVVLPGADADTARELAETMRSTVEDSSLGATVSIGVAAHQPQADIPVTTLVSAADTALYQAKTTGRNCVVLAADK